MKKDSELARLRPHIAKLQLGGEKKEMELESRKRHIRINGLEPMDYDAPGTTVRESGV